MLTLETSGSAGSSDIALRDGNWHTFIHHYHEAARVTSEQALARYARREPIIIYGLTMMKITSLRN